MANVSLWQIHHILPRSTNWCEAFVGYVDRRLGSGEVRVTGDFLTMALERMTDADLVSCPGCRAPIGIYELKYWDGINGWMPQSPEDVARWRRVRARVLKETDGRVDIFGTAASMPVFSVIGSEDA